MIYDLTAQEVIGLLNLEPLVQEGGYFRRTYKSNAFVSKEVFEQYSGARKLFTCIYYLITPEAFSALHVLLSEEVWCFHAGDPIKMVEINVQGDVEETVIGPDIQVGHKLQHIVNQKKWQGAKLLSGGKWCLVSCMVSPGFEFDDADVASASKLINMFPQHESLIHAYTQPS